MSMKASSPPPQWHPDRDHSDGGRDGIRSCREVGAGHADARCGLSPDAVARRVALTGCPLPADIRLLRAIVLHKIDIYAELSAQVRKIIAAGIVPTHLDAHKHTHVLPPVASAIARLVREFGIRWVRKPFDFGGSPGLRLVCAVDAHPEQRAAAQTARGGSAVHGSFRRLRAHWISG